MKILVAEDEKDMLKIIKLYLEKAGYYVETALDGRQALEMVYAKKYDLLISDWMMPKMSGLDLCREIRACSIPIKIIMLTAKSETTDEIKGLTCGADDYIKKPFEPQLLIIRIQKMFQIENALTCGELVLNIENHTVFAGQNEIKVTQKEWQLLQYFMRNKGITLTRDKLIETVWGTDYDGDERTLDTHIRRLRNKIGDGYISTFVGVGYRMNESYE